MIPKKKRTPFFGDAFFLVLLSGILIIRMIALIEEYGSPYLYRENGGR